MKNLTMICAALALLPTVARADQQQWLEVVPAARAAQLLASADEIRHFCQPCRDTTATTEAVDSVELGKVAFDRRRPGEAATNPWWHVMVNGRDVDLAYVYVAKDGQWRNLALLLDLPVSGTSPWLAGVALSADAPPPLADGDHTFTMRFAEHPLMPGLPVRVHAAGGRVQVIVEGNPHGMAPGVIDEGELFLHPSGRWIVAAGEAQRNADEVGGCSDGPAEIDLETREYWTC